MPPTEAAYCFPREIGSGRSFVILRSRAFASLSHVCAICRIISRSSGDRARRASSRHSSACLRYSATVFISAVWAMASKGDTAKFKRGQRGLNGASTADLFGDPIHVAAGDAPKDVVGRRFAKARNAGEIVRPLTTLGALLGRPRRIIRRHLRAPWPAFHPTRIH